MEHSDLTEKIIGSAFRVYGEMGFGFLESVYERCLIIESRILGIEAESQKPITVHYHEERVGEFVVDPLVERVVLVKLESVRNPAKAHEVQLVNYPNETRLNVGPLINFGDKKV